MIKKGIYSIPENNKDITILILNSAVNNTLSENPILNYIKFMDSLEETEREEILLNKEVTELINRINSVVA